MTYVVRLVLVIYKINVLHVMMALDKFKFCNTVKYNVSVKLDIQSWVTLNVKVKE